jgi:hypothetical protein
MRYSKWALLTVLVLALAGFSGCSGDKPLTDAEKKQVNDDMQKAIEHNAKGGGRAGGTPADADMEKAMRQNQGK